MQMYADGCLFFGRDCMKYSIRIREINFTFIQNKFILEINLALIIFEPFFAQKQILSPFRKGGKTVVQNHIFLSATERKNRSLGLHI